MYFDHVDLAADADPDGVAPGGYGAGAGGSAGGESDFW